MLDHLTEAELDQFVAETLPPDALARVDEHLNHCEWCLEKVASRVEELARAMAGVAFPSRASSPEPPQPQLVRRIERSLQEEPPPDEQLSLDAPPLEFIARVDRGGMGEVVEYRDRGFNRSVAVKYLKSQQACDPAVVSRFRREMELTASIDHPGCPMVYGRGRSRDGREFFLMQLVTGPTLGERIDQFHRKPVASLRRSDLQFRRLLELFRDICRIVGAAHERQILHRDLKPANVRIHRDGHPLVLDWGLARRMGDVEPVTVDTVTVDTVTAETETAETESSLQLFETAHAGALGTVVYMSPEQARGQRQAETIQTDIYGLGGILYEILTHAPPHHALALPTSNLPDMLRAIGQGAMPSMAGIPGELASICTRCLAFKPEDRYESAEQLGEEIERWLANEPVIAHRYRLLGRAALWVQRHALVSVVSAMAACVLLVVTITAFYFWEKARTEREFAEVSYGLALKAHRALVDDVQEELQEGGNAANARRRLLERAIEGMTNLVERASAAPGAELVASQGRLELAHLLRRERGDLAQARRIYHDEVSFLRRYGDQAFRSPQYFRLLGDALKYEAQCVEASDGKDAAHALHGQLRQVIDQFRSAYPTDSAALMMESQWHLFQSWQLEPERPEDRELMERHLLDASRAMQSVPASKASDPDYVYQRLYVLTEQAALRAVEQRWEDAISLQRQSVEQMREVVRQNPTRRFQLGLVQDEVTLADYLRSSGALAEAAQQLEQSRQRADELARQFPNDHAVGQVQSDIRLRLDRLQNSSRSQ